MTDIDEIAKEIQKQLQKYGKACREDVEKAKKIVSKQAKEDIAQHSPKRRPEYKDGWTVKKVGDSYIVHNKDNYQLTHLLEHGHVTRDGSSRTKAQPHIGPAEAYAINDYLKRVKKALKA